MNESMNQSMNQSIEHIYNVFNYDIAELINKHYLAILIQNSYRLNRPLTKLEIGNRIFYFSNKGTIKYGTITEIKKNHCKVQLTPQIIPNWKKSNISFWDSFSYIFPYCTPTPVFPYYTPRPILIKKCKITKLNSWNKLNDFSEYLNYDLIDNSQRIKIYKNFS